MRRLSMVYGTIILYFEVDIRGVDNDREVRDYPVVFRALTALLSVLSVQPERVVNSTSKQQHEYLLTQLWV